MDMWLVLFWTGPIGVGFFLVCLGAFIWFIARASEIGKRTPTVIKEKQ
jgi:hypothetical protein